MKLTIPFFVLTFVLFSCKKEPLPSLKTELENPEVKLSNQYIIACAAGMPDGFMGETSYPVSMFFYPVNGASNFRYFETTTDNVNQWDYSRYNEVSVSSVPVFNGYLRRFPLTKNKNRWGIVTYKVGDSVRICDPVYIKVKSQATVWAPHRINIQDQGINPKFSWQEYSQYDNAIHFNVVSDTAKNLISGTYTLDTHWTFYDLSNVTLNIRDINPAPMLSLGKRYTFTLMSVSKDNWVTTFGQKEFTAR